MKNMEQNKNNLQVIKFDKNNIPTAWESRESSDLKYVTYGMDNLYPNFLLSLYNESPIHASIINSKTTYILGDGLKYKEGDTDLDFNVNDSDNIKEFADKIIKDYLLFNAFAVEVIFNIGGEVIEYHHVPMHKLRYNRTKTRFWFNDDWSMSRKQLQYDRYGKFNEGTSSKIFFFDGYFPTINNVYPQPEYNGCIKSITTDMAIRSFNLNNIKNHFSVSSIITFFQGGNVPDEVKQEVISKLKQSYTGEEGKKMIVDFQNIQGGKAAEVTSLSPNDWSEAYTEIAKKVSDDIFIGHQVTSPMLMGVKTEGQLGGATELETAYEIFVNTYIRVKRDELESGLNQLFSANKNIKGKIYFADKPLFTSKLTDSTKEKVLTINELRAIAGLPVIATGDRLLTDAPAPAVAVAHITDEHIEEVKKKPSSKKLTEDDYELIKDMGSSSEDFEVIGDADESYHAEFALVDDIAQYVIGNDIKGLTLPELVDVLKSEGGLDVSENKLQDILKDLNDSGVVKIEIDEADRIKITPSKTGSVPDTDSVFVMYKYIKKPEVSGGDLLPASRSFCVKLININRLYKRSEIQDMSAIFGYDIFKFTGGFYYNPETDTTTSSCRHQWKALQVKRKG